VLRAYGTDRTWDPMLFPATKCDPLIPLRALRELMERNPAPCPTLVRAAFHTAACHPAITWKISVVT